MRAAVIVPLVAQLAEAAIQRLLEQQHQTVEHKKVTKESTADKENERNRNNNVERKSITKDSTKETKGGLPKVALVLAGIRSEHNRRFLATLDAQNKAAALKATTKDVMSGLRFASTVRTSLAQRLR